MDIRRFLNSNPIVAILGVLIVLGICGWVVYGQLKPSGIVASNYAYFTIDDGKTWFTDSRDKLPPFEHEGKQAVGVRMFRCLNTTEPFVGYLERYTDKGKAILDKYRAEQAATPGVMPPSAGALAALGQAAVEVKKPGESDWVLGGSAKANTITQVTCKEGSGAFVVEAK